MDFFQAVSDAVDIVQSCYLGLNRRQIIPRKGLHIIVSQDKDGLKKASLKTIDCHESTYGNKLNGSHSVEESEGIYSVSVTSSIETPEKVLKLFASMILQILNFAE
jgi:hypothetical protein